MPDITKARKELGEIITRHLDNGGSQGDTDNGCGFIDHCCATCGSFGEYGVAWPCDTYLSASKAYRALS